MDGTRAGSLLDREKQRRGLLSFRSSKRLQFASAVDDAKKQVCPPSSSPTSRSVDSKLLWPSVESNQKRVGEIMPERFQLLEEFYSAMEASISLLNIRRATCSFSAVAMAVENSTHRRFLRKHLAQIKYILPETLNVDEFKAWNSDTQSFFKDLRITLLPMSTQCLTNTAAKGQAKPKAATQMVLRIKEFHKRLVEFLRAHPQDDDEVPEADVLGNTSGCFAAVVTEEKEDGADRAIMLHTAFDPSQLKKFPRSPSTASAARKPTPATPLSHFSGVFKRHFSTRALRSMDAEPTTVDAAPVEAAHSDAEVFIEEHSHSEHLTSEVKLTETSCSYEKDYITVPTTPNKSSSSSALLAQDVIISPPNRSFISGSKFQDLTPCSILSNPFASPTSSTPHQDVSTPIRAAAAASPNLAEPLSKAPKNASGRMKQAIIKSLRFGGTPTKDNIHHDGRVKESHALKDEIDANISVKSDLQLMGSPTIRTRAGLARSKQNISRVLPFNSPKRPLSSELNDTFNSPSPKRLKVCASQDDVVYKQKHGTVVSDEITRMLLFDSPKSSFSKLKETVKPCPERLKVSSDPGGVLYKQVKDASPPDQRHGPVTSAEYQLSASEREMLQCLPKELVDDVQAKERKLMEDNEGGVEEARRRKHMIGGLPKLFNAVRLIFQSANRTVFTCKDLTRMVLSSHPDITDQDEIIEQLQLLVDLAPQWISAKLSSTGERVYRISKGADMKRISKILSQAV